MMDQPRSLATLNRNASFNAGIVTATSGIQFATSAQMDLRLHDSKHCLPCELLTAHGWEANYGNF